LAQRADGVAATAGLVRASAGRPRGGLGIMKAMNETREPLLTEDEVNDLLNDDRDAGWEDEDSYDWSR
jgi:hypothetical protein